LVSSSIAQAGSDGGQEVGDGIGSQQGDSSGIFSRDKTVDDTLEAVTQLVASMRTAWGYVVKALRAAANDGNGDARRRRRPSVASDVPQAPPSIAWGTAVSMCKAASWTLRFAPRLRAQALAWRQEASTRGTASLDAEHVASGEPDFDQQTHAIGTPIIAVGASPLARQWTGFGDIRGQQGDAAPDLDPDAEIISGSESHATGRRASVATRQSVSPSAGAIAAARGDGSAETL